MRCSAVQADDRAGRSSLPVAGPPEPEEQPHGGTSQHAPHEP
ncbi:hypothetical protein [Streptomyces anandii]